jgi:hypothetical protein
MLPTLIVKKISARRWGRARRHLFSLLITCARLARVRKCALVSQSARVTCAPAQASCILCPMGLIRELGVRLIDETGVQAVPVGQRIEDVEEFPDEAGKNQRELASANFDRFAEPAHYLS